MTTTAKKKLERRLKVLEEQVAVNTREREYLEDKQKRALKSLKIQLWCIEKAQEIMRNSTKRLSHG